MNNCRMWLQRACAIIMMLAFNYVVSAEAIKFELVKVQVKQLTLEVELADTPQLRAQGLMHRTTAKPGMLFVYPYPQQTAFWMRNTLIPLDLAYIDQQGTIVAIIQMNAMDDTTHPSPTAIVGALEMELGWYAKQGIKVGDVIQIGQY
ncbi:DUF192 domain-containing protein [Alteromonadaceae bacterium BrNp21-10]|nr:DUF192 domain-containing protein [Alteromonadaceae bacterium BrNp21-10]